MKKLFVIYNINNTQTKEKHDKLETQDKKDNENTIQNLKLNENSLNISNSFQSTLSNSTEDSRKYSLNMPCQESSSLFVVNSFENSSASKKENNNFLGKKVKFQLEIVKENPSNIKNSDNQDQEKILRNETRRNDIFILEDTTNIKLFQKKKRKIKKEKNSLSNEANEGRWSNEEHTKFIEAIVKYGKNWKSVQKYVGTRTTAQARSHAQKFLMKIKMLKFSSFDFSNIKNLLHVINEIKRKKNNNEEEEKFLIKTLKNLTETITRDNYKRHFIKFTKKFKNLKKIQFKNEKIKTDNILNHDAKDSNKSNNNKNNIVEPNKIENKEPEKKKEEETANNKINNNIIINEENIIIPNDVNEKKENKGENDIKKIEIQQKSLEENTPLKDHNYWNYWLDSNKRLIVDDGVAIYLDEKALINYNKTSLRARNYYFNECFESSFINKDFFS